GREHGPALGERDHGDGPRQPGGGKARALYWIDRDVHLRPQAVAYLLAEEEHRRLVFFPLADDHSPLHVDGRERFADRFHRALVRRLLVAAALERGRRQRAGLRHPQQLEREVAIDLGFFDHVERELNSGRG